MSRNRMRNSQSLHWMGVLRGVIVFGFLSVLGLSYMFCKNQNLRLADQTLVLQKKLAAIERHNTTLDLDLQFMKNPEALKRRLVQMRSTLVPLYDPRMLAHITRMEGQSTRMTLARMGTIPHVDISPSPVSADDSVAPLSSPNSP